MKFVAWLVTVVLLILAVLFTLLSLGTFASMVQNVPLWLRSLGSLESTLALNLGHLGLESFVRALILGLLASIFFGMAAYFKPRRQL